MSVPLSLNIDDNSKKENDGLTQDGERPHKGSMIVQEQFVVAFEAIDEVLLLSIAHISNASLPIHNSFHLAKRFVASLLIFFPLFPSSLPVWRSCSLILMTSSVLLGAVRGGEVTVQKLERQFLEIHFGLNKALVGEDGTELLGQRLGDVLLHSSKRVRLRKKERSNKLVPRKCCIVD